MADPLAWLDDENAKRIKRYRKVARTSPALMVRGVVERYQGVTNLLAQRIEPLPLGLADALRSRDFR